MYVTSKFKLAFKNLSCLRLFLFLYSVEMLKILYMPQYLVMAVIIRITPMMSNTILRGSLFLVFNSIGRCISTQPITALINASKSPTFIVHLLVHQELYDLFVK